jgi:hypothetical protein
MHAALHEARGILSTSASQPAGQVAYLIYRVAVQDISLESCHMQKSELDWS